MLVTAALELRTDFRAENRVSSSFGFVYRSAPTNFLPGSNAGLKDSLAAFTSFSLILLTIHLQRRSARGFLKRNFSDLAFLMSENVLLSDLALDELDELTELAEPELELRDLRDLRDDLAMLSTRESEKRSEGLWPLYLARKVVCTPPFSFPCFLLQNAITRSHTHN